jgi:hypothetical protein
MVCGDQKNIRKMGLSMWSSQHSTVTVMTKPPRRSLFLGKRITGTISSMSPPCYSAKNSQGLPPNINQSFTAKSLRKGLIGELILHSDITVFQACARMGHSTNTSIDSYIDATHPAKAIPAINVLAGKSNIHAHIVLPKLNAIGLLNPAHVDKLVDTLFSVNVPAFDKCGHLRVVLRTGAASLIMHHSQLTRKYPGNTISSHLYEAASGARIIKPRFLDLSPDLVLDEWSKLVEADFKSASIAAEFSLQSADAKLDSLVKMVKSLMDITNGLKAQNGENMLQMADQKARLSRQQRDI